MPLTHVYYWESKIGYRPISIEEADRLYDHGDTVPADKTSRFVCGLCAQHVGFSKRRKGTGTRHFYHSRGEQNKECEDRAQAYDHIQLQLNSHPMPIRLKLCNGHIQFQLGFFFPQALQDVNVGEYQIVIHSAQSEPLVYSSERIEHSGITYLYAGNEPSKKYTIEYFGLPKEYTKFWPIEVSAVSENGTFFEYESGQMVQPGSKAVTNRKYFLLQSEMLFCYPSGISQKLVARIPKPIYGTAKQWYLYEIVAKEFSEEVAQFFLKRSVFLTEKPVAFYPVWPPYVEDPYFLYHNDSTMYFYMQGEDAELNTYPASIAPRFLNIEEGKLYKIYAASKEQLLSLGQSGAIGFSYLMKKNLDMVASSPQLEIKNIDGKLVKQDICNQLPKGKQITIQAPFDGKIIILRNGNVLEIRNIAAEQITNVDNLSFGYEIQIFQGCDLLRTICFKKLQSDTNYTEQDRQLVEKLRRCKGAKMPVSHNIGAAEKQLLHFPLSRQWLYQKIRQGKISADAIKLLASYKNTKMED